MSCLLSIALCVCLLALNWKKYTCVSKWSNPDNFVNIPHGYWTQCYHFPCFSTYCISSVISCVQSNCHKVKPWLEIPRPLLMFSRWTRHQKQLKTFLPWLFLWQQRVLHKAVQKGKKGNLLPASMPDGTSSFDNQHLMFSYSRIVINHWLTH